jgi:hypothetical protein
LKMTCMYELNDAISFPSIKQLTSSPRDRK